MADVSLSAWKKCAAANDGADGKDMTKALEAYEKTPSGKDFDAEIEALDGVIDEVKSSRRANAKLKPVLAHLADLLKAAEKERAALVKKADEAESEDESSDAKAELILKTRLKKVQRLKQDAAKPFVLALGTISGLMPAKAGAVSPEDRKMAKEMRAGKGKLMRGLCFGEAGKLIFLFAVNPPGGLARAIRKAIVSHTQKKTRVIVRGPGGDFDSETDETELTDFGTEEPETNEIGGDEDGIPTAPTPPPPPPPTPPPPPPPTATTTDRPPPTPTGENGNGQTAAPKPRGAMVQYAMLRLSWEKARQKAHADIAALEGMIVDEFEDEPELDEVKLKVRLLDQALDGFDDRLQDLLDEGGNLPPESRGDVNAQALLVIDDYQSFLAGDPFLRELDDNPFRPLQLEKVLGDTLKLLAKKLEA